MKHQRHRRKPDLSVPCPICGGKVEGFHFGILACRPCSSFFRRTVASKQSYRCALNNRCDVSYEIRTVCKGCRMSRCLAAGMKVEAVQNARDPIGPKLREPKIEKMSPMETFLSPASASTSSAHSSRSTSALVPDEPMSLLQKMLESYTAFKRAEISLYHLLFPERPVNLVEEYALVRHTDFIKMERGALSFTHQLIAEFYPPFLSFLPNEKAQILKAFFGHFTCLLKGFRSFQTYPNEGDPRILMSFGQFLDAEGLEFHYGDDPQPALSAKSCYPLYAQTRRLADKIARFKMTETEFIAVLGIILCNEVRLVHPNEEVETFHDRLIFELHEEIRRTHPPSAVGSRLGAAILFANDADIMQRLVSEVVTLQRVFNPHLIELYE
ncbi:hypothetical protein M3Y99_01015600 [Aphelenchoides fujianensis]|nr:hypothetical protein M3Y99_01015600 [Aphelenchoides fujianensis]